MTHETGVWSLAASVVFAAAALAAQVPITPATPDRPILFEHARIITGDGSTPIENGAFAIDRGRLVAIGRAGAVSAPPTATRVDLAGKTVMPALVDTHVHLGYQRGLSFAADNFTRDNLIDQLHRYASAGVGVVMSLGTDLDDLPFQLRAEQQSGRLDGAWYLTAGRGLAAPNAGPGTPEMRGAPYGITTEAEARSAVREQVGKKVDFVKIWVDDRNGTVPKLSPALYRAAIDEAHRLHARVIAHVFYLDDAKDLARAGVDGFAHLPRDREADAELVSLMARGHVFMIPNMAISENAAHAQPPSWLDDPLLHALVSEAEIARLRETYARRTPESVARAEASWARMKRTLMTLKRGRVTIGFGTDDGAVRDHFYAYTPHRELQLMVEAGMTPADAITAATKTSAGILQLDALLGTISRGKSADFIILDANPLENIANTEKIAAVYLRGARVPGAKVPGAKW